MRQLPGKSKTKILPALRRLQQRLSVVEGYVAAISLLVLLAGALVQIVARNFFDTGFIFIEPITRHLVIFVALMGAILATDAGRHIKIDVATTCVPAQTMRRIAPVFYFFSAIFSAIFCWYSVLFWWDEWIYAPANEKWVVPMALILPIGFGLLALHFLLLSVLGLEDEPDNPRQCSS